MTAAARRDVPSSPVTRCPMLPFRSSTHAICIFHLHTPLIAVEAMNNRSFILLLKEICNTWNRMKYVVYPRAWQTQSASVASVCVTRWDRKKIGEQRKQASVTPDRPSDSCGNYSPGRGLEAKAGDSHHTCLHAGTKDVPFRMGFVLLFSGAGVITARGCAFMWCQRHRSKPFNPIRKIFQIHIPKVSWEICTVCPIECPLWIWKWLHSFSTFCGSVERIWQH